jgi:hypothetical protein
MRLAFLAAEMVEHGGANCRRAPTFRWKDYAQTSQPTIMTLQATEFIRRFLLHILPSGFVKIRYFGFLANRDRHAHIQLCRTLLGSRQHGSNAGELAVKP